MGDHKSDESLKVETGSFPTSSRNGFTHLITGHRNGHNYTQWVRSVEIFLQGNGREGYITGDSKCPEKGDTNLQKWQLENSQLLQQTMLTAGKSGTAVVAQKGNFLHALNTSKGNFFYSVQ